MISFLRTVFGVGENHRMFQEDVLRWKCFAPHPFWEGSRGYALRYQDRIAAFGCVVPCRFLTGSGSVASCNVIDWAASKTVPGAGIMLYRHIASLAGTMINIGGTADARQILPRIGFQARADIHHYTRVVRPWHHLMLAERKDWKSPLRLARDYRELARSSLPAGRTLAVRRVSNFDALPAGVFPDPCVTRQVICARTATSLGYFLNCPAANVEGYVLERNGTPAGYFLLSRSGHQCRIADLWLQPARPQDWAAAYSSAVAAAAVNAHTVQVTAAASHQPQIEALRQAGFRHTHSEPVFVHDPDRRLGDPSGLALSFLENDGFYWPGSAAHPG